MSAHELHAGHDDHGHDHDDLHVTKGDYVKGFILAVILTVIPFWLVMADVIQNRTTAVLVLGIFAMVQAAGGLLHVSLHMHHVRPLLISAVVPHAAYFFGLPLVTSIITSSME